MPSHIPDPGPLVVPEAMSAGVIVIGYPAGGIPFSIQDGISGLLIENAADVGIALKKLVETPGAYARMRHDAHGRILTTFGSGYLPPSDCRPLPGRTRNRTDSAATQARVENQES